MGPIAQTSCASLLVMMVAMYCLIAVVATGTVPGIKWSHLEVWENSAAHDVWTRPHEYLDFRSYVLSTLGDMGYINLPIRGPGKTKSTLSTPRYPTSHSNQKPGVGSFDAPRRVGLGFRWLKNTNNFFLNYSR